MMKAVAYYRARPSEPEASDLALRFQREAVRREVEGRGLTLVAEFVEREGEEGSEACPAYASAVRAASAGDGGDNALDTGPISLDTVLIIPSQGAIGTGEPFQEPEIGVEDMGPGGFIRSYLQAPTVPTPPEIASPPGAPGPLCLHAVCRPGQLDTLVYLCNAGMDALAEVAVATDTTSMNQFFTSESGERWAEGTRTHEQRWDVVAPGRCVLVDSLSHVKWDLVGRHRLTFADAAGRRWMTEADDLALNACWLSRDPEGVWVAFGPACAADRPAPARRTEGAP